MAVRFRWALDRAGQLPPAIGHRLGERPGAARTRRGDAGLHGERRRRSALAAARTRPADVRNAPTSAAGLPAMDNRQVRSTAMSDRRLDQRPRPLRLYWP